MRLTLLHLIPIYQGGDAVEERQNNATKTISVVMLITLVGKILGLYRDRLLAVHYSTQMEANAFFTASRIPRVFFDAVFASAIAACFIRLGNLMNGEIVGKLSNVPWAFIFPREGMEPRHPAQLYEAIAYLIIFVIGLSLYKKYKTSLLPGFYFGYCLTTIFVFRFFVEFIKASQEAYEDSMMLNMGQWLSIPFILIGAHFMYHSFKPAKNK